MARISVASRAAATSKVMKAIAVGPNRVRLPFRSDDGSFPLVVTLPNENVSDVVEQVRLAGGKANVAVAFAKKFRIVTLSSRPTPPESGLVNINRELSMGMLLIQVDQSKKNKTQFVFGEGEVQIPALQGELSYA